MPFCGSIPAAPSTLARSLSWEAPETGEALLGVGEGCVSPICACWQKDFPDAYAVLGFLSAMVVVCYGGGNGECVAAAVGGAQRWGSAVQDWASTFAIGEAGWAVCCCATVVGCYGGGPRSRPPVLRRAGCGAIPFCGSAPVAPSTLARSLSWENPLAGFPGRRQAANVVGW